LVLDGETAPAEVTTPDQPRTHLLQPGPGTGVDTSLPRAACGAAVADDGFCTVCGHRARTRREHWTETRGTGTGLTIGAVCDKGIAHAGNEDAMATTITAAGTAVVVVCDGVTTAPDSDRASLAASAAACEVLAAAPASAGSFASRLSSWEPVLVAACRAANGETIAIARTLGDPPEPPSCTFVASVVDGDLIGTAWCGDSRAYWLPDVRSQSDRGEQLTLDHSLGTEMIRAGMTREQAEADPTCHTITRWLGADSVDATPEFRAMRVEQPGWLLVCSDGMWNYASTPDELGELVARAVGDGATTATSIAESMAAFANEQGGHDNITVALVRCAPTAQVDPPAAG
jgi:serine/threonine protein phosphatase PrpC